MLEEKSFKYVNAKDDMLKAESKFEVEELDSLRFRENSRACSERAFCDRNW